MARETHVRGGVPTPEGRNPGHLNNILCVFRFLLVLSFSLYFLSILYCLSLLSQFSLSLSLSSLSLSLSLLSQFSLSLSLLFSLSLSLSLLSLSIYSLSLSLFSLSILSLFSLLLFLFSLSPSLSILHASRTKGLRGDTALVDVMIAVGEGGKGSLQGKKNIRERKNTKINKFAGLSQNRVGVKKLFMSHYVFFFRVIPYGGEETHK